MLTDAVADVGTPISWRRLPRSTLLAMALALGAVGVKSAHQLIRQGAGPLEVVLRQLVFTAPVLLAALLVLGVRRGTGIVGLWRYGCAVTPRAARRWTFLPATAVLGLWLLVGVVAGTLSFVPWADGVQILVGTALGEEIIFRGLVYGLAIGSGSRTAAVVSSATFGLWHSIDAVHGINPTWPLLAQIGFVGGTVLLMFGIGLAVFAPLRRATGSIWGVVFLHAAWNLGANLVLRL